MSYNELLLDLPMDHMENIFGQFDANIKLIESTLHVSFVARGDNIKILGDEESVKSASDVIEELLALSKKGETITEQTVQYLLSIGDSGIKSHALLDASDDCICHTVTGKPVKPKTIGQKTYVDAIRKQMIVFGLGPAGTGKTYLAMAMAITAFSKGEVGRIILTRPAIEAGEKLGFLPGDLQSKIDPYLRPLYDALYQIMGAESFQRNLEKGLIEVAPLAYMRGRTLDNAFIILDEAQNTDAGSDENVSDAYRLWVQGSHYRRCHPEGSPAGAASGLDVAMRVLKNVDEISVCQLTGKDVVRHPLVQKIVNAYEDYERKNAEAEKRAKKRRGKR